MSDNSVIEINDDTDEINVDENVVDENDVDKIDVGKIDVDKIDVDKNDVDKIFTFDYIDYKNDVKPHNGKPITMIEISPNEKYLITYSEKDYSVVGWNVEDMDKVQLKFDKTVEINEINKDNTDNKYGIKSLCVSDDKKLACVYRNESYSVIDMGNKNNKIALDLNEDEVGARYCTFNLKGEFILYSEFYTHSVFGLHKIIWIYSTQTKNNKWKCKRFYRIPEDYELISISKYDKIYLVSNDYIYEWNINTEKGVKIFDNNKDKDENKGNNKDNNKFKTKYIGIFSKEKFISLKINDKIIIYSIELGITIASLDINDDIQLYNIMNHTGLFLLPSLIFYYTPDKGIHNSNKYCWNNKYKNIFNQTLFDKPTDEQTKFVFGIQNERVWKSKFDEKMPKTNFSSEYSHELNKENNKSIECNDNDKIIKETYEHSNIHLYPDTIPTLFQNAITNDINSKNELTESAENLIKWDILIEDGKINLTVIKKHNTEWNLINRIEDYDYPYKTKRFLRDVKNDHKLIAISLYNNNDIVILTTFGILIYTFSENSTSISLNYFYYMKFDVMEYDNSKYIKKKLQYYKRIFSKSTLPLPNYDSFRLGGWVSNIKNNRSRLLKYGVELLTFAIKEHKLELIDEIYKICMTYFKEDLLYNKSFLSIITSTMPLLDKYYPEYILRYSSETNMIIDSSFYSIEHQNKNLHLYSFIQSPQIANLSKSYLWTKFYNIYTFETFEILRASGNPLLINLATLFERIVMFIQDLIILLTFPIYFATFYILSKYNFINNIYPSDAFSFVYFFVDLKIFKEGITTIPTITFMIPYINFVNYSKDYSWFLELIRPQPSPFTETINRNIYKSWNGEALINFKWNAYGKYYYAMIWILFMALLGCFTAAATIPQKYINEEVRQQLFIASIILGSIHLIFEIRQFFYNVIKWFYNFWNIFVLFIIIISFAHAFYILLSPRSEFSFEQPTNNNDPNNPWNLASSYNQIIDNDRNINSNPSMIQTPNKNTNMFIDIRTSLFAMYLLLAGDSSALSNWEYTDNPSIAILIVLFSLLVVVYLMNLLIGLLNIEIGEDNNRVSYLIQKAEILAEIELFYLLPHQRRWHTWFPEVMHYYTDADKTRIEIKRLIEVGEWDTKEFTEMRENLFKVLGINHNPIGNELILEKLKSNDEILEKLKYNEEKLKSNDEILEKLKSNNEKLENLEKKLEKLGKLLEEIHAK
ncbi:hypothetical protein C1646_748964 [Rhizophagus diaphanus]|nr:hypothetical protein C1646_748964 [Rhizophagus diaphanus] [Rhizophagus sp. MUCL 43196]